MQKTKSGFTLVELIIVIAVIGILAAISVISYNGIQNRALNASRLSEVTAWRDLLETYHVKHGELPPVTPGNYCLGSGFPSGACRDYQANNVNTYYEANNTQLMTALADVSSLPSGPRKPVNGTVGPYVNIWPGSSGFTITEVFNGQSDQCPAIMTYSWDDGNGRLLCYINIQYY